MRMVKRIYQWKKNSKWPSIRAKQKNIKERDKNSNSNQNPKSLIFRKQHWNLSTGFVVIVINQTISQYKGELYNIEQLRNDFAVFRSALEEAHPGLYFYKTKNTIDSIFSSAYNSITELMTANEFTILLSKVTSQIGDGHLHVIPPEVLIDTLENGTTTIPFKVYWKQHNT